MIKMARIRDHINDIWHPSLTPHQGTDSLIDLSFNFWMHHRFISDSEIQELILSVLLGIQLPSFLECSKQLFKANKIVLVALRGVSSMDLSELMAANKLPFLSMCSTVPIRHSITATREELPQSSNIMPPDMSWKCSDVASMNSLLLWPVVPAVTFEEIAAYKGNVGAIFQNYRLVFQVPLIFTG
jgi:hypothetical protein